MLEPYKVSRINKLKCNIDIINIFFNYGDQVSVLYYNLGLMYTKYKLLRVFISIDLKLKNAH